MILKKIILKLLLLHFCLFNLSSTSAQNNIEIKSIKTNYGYLLSAINKEEFEVSIKLNFNLNNLVCKNSDSIFVVAAKSQQQIQALQILDTNLSYSYNLSYKCYLGNVVLDKYDTNFQYHLPYKSNQFFKLDQGYLGNISHQNDYALDFTMPLKTEITAAREGKVIQVIDFNNKNCPTSNCTKYNNYITILHSDGTYAKYVHIAFKSSKVKVGQLVKQDEIIALSGNVGFTTGPHLHFELNLPSTNLNCTIKSLFLINNNLSTYLIEGESYLKDY